MITGTENGIRVISRGRPLIKFVQGCGWLAFGKRGYHGAKLAAAISFCQRLNNAQAKQNKNHVVELSGGKIEVRCDNAKCGAVFVARAADRKRGWGRFCSKSCKAAEQEKRTGQHAAHERRVSAGYNSHDNEEFSDAHLFSNEDHDCNKD